MYLQPSLQFQYCQSLISSILLKNVVIHFWKNNMKIFLMNRLAQLEFFPPISKDPHKSLFPKSFSLGIFAFCLLLLKHATLAKPIQRNNFYCFSKKPLGASVLKTDVFLRHILTYIDHSLSV